MGNLSVKRVSRKMTKGIATLTRPLTDFFPLSATVTKGIVN